MNQNKKVVYITKYALTQGLWVVDEDLVEFCGSMIVVTPPKGLKMYCHGQGKDWHMTRESADARIQKMIERRRKSLRKSLSELGKLETMGVAEVVVSRGTA